VQLLDHLLQRDSPLLDGMEEERQRILDRKGMAFGHRETEAVNHIQVRPKMISCGREELRQQHTTRDLDAFLLCFAKHGQLLQRINLSGWAAHSKRLYDARASAHAM
jgi:hypothetical protein